MVAEVAAVPARGSVRRDPGHPEGERKRGIRHRLEGHQDVAVVVGEHADRPQQPRRLGGDELVGERAAGDVGGHDGVGIVGHPRRIRP